ncbi:hypothetical protein SASPL_129513 [Salvia splendens]|uniref:Uncharacterized protein n=1 Tax=Salvia splendens TaxID=180675 RepID=A0A8X8ZNU3_SALSN|nr:hypothetical protein SASPL_129513 [Salvia splendens]
MASFGSIKQEIFDKQARKQQYQDNIRGLNAFDRHKKFLNDYGHHFILWLQLLIMEKRNLLEKYCRLKLTKTPLEKDIGRFIMTEEDDMNHSWEHKLVKRYYDKLFKEYPLHK